MRPAAILLLAGTVWASAAAGQPPAPAEVVIRVGWTGQDKPGGVEFDGDRPFVSEAAEYVGRRTQQNHWATNDLAILYDADEFPLRVITRAGGDPVRFRVIKAAFSQCARADVNAIWSERPATVNARISLMMRARTLMNSGLCPTAERWKLAKRYFDTSCSLAMDPNSAIDLSPDAQARYRQLAVTAAQRREAETCTALVQQRAISALLSRSAVAAEAGDSTAFTAANGELLAHVENPRWREGFAALRIDETKLRADQVKELYGRQIEAFNRGDRDTALSANDELQGLAASDTYNAALSAVRVDPQRLTDDRAAITSLAGPE